MDIKKIEKHIAKYKDLLLNDCLPFWLKNSLDREYGGYITCLDRKGNVYNTDKSIWFQGRETWVYSRLYNAFGKRPEWLEAARLGCKFIEKYCYDADGRMFFSVTRDGKPLQKRRYMFSETFAVIGLAEYSRASGDSCTLERAKNTFRMVESIYRNPSGIVPKINPETRRTKSLSLPMILLSTIQVLRDVENTTEYDEFACELVQAILKDFLKPDEKALFETVGANGERLDNPQGRCVNPGHSIETAWFLMHEGMYRKDKDIIANALKILDWSIEIGWDKEYGGILYFVDIEGKPPEQLEWDMKLWWPHTEALYALLLAFYLTNDRKYEAWFDKVHQWSFNHFADKEYGEWFGYLHRDGSVSNTLKGSMWKGPFHLPRALLLAIQILEKMRLLGQNAKRL